MSEPQSTSSNEQSTSGRFLPLLLVLFVGSGFAALVYEIVWFQMIQLVIGSSAVSLAVLLGTFMGGMCLGSLLLPRLVSARRHPLRVYAVIELGIGVCALALLFGLPHIDRVYAAVAGTGYRAILLRGAVCAACLLPPTMLMGATLPAIARWIEATPRGISWLGFFYGGNIAGAVCGCLLAGFYLLRVHDIVVATYVAASVNGAISLLALILARWTVHADNEQTRESWGVEEDAAVLASRWSVYVTIALSGASALAAEVIWTRLLSLMLGATVYTFSIILAVFLIGLGIGSGLGSLLSRTTTSPRLLLAGCQLLLGAAIVWTAYILATSLPYWPINTYLTQSPWHLFQLDLLRCAWALLPATCLWGASFPLALAASAGQGQDPGRLVGTVYAANTIGAIVGAIGASLFLVHSLGTDRAQRLLIGICGLAAVCALLPYLWAARNRLHVAGASVILAIIAGTTTFVVTEESLPSMPWELIAFGRSLPITNQAEWGYVYHGEGMNSSVAVTTRGFVRNFHVSGKVEASSDPTDMKLQRMLGHIPALLHPQPRSVLIVGCGAGVTAGCFVVHPDIERIVICDIEPLVPQKIAPHFAAENHNVVNDPRVEIVYDDARHYILTTPHTFDIITSDPIHPWVKGSATLYTKEYFELCKRRLNPGGLITQWVPLYETNDSVVKSEFVTFFDAFPEGTVWSNNLNGQGYDVVLLGQVDPLRIDADEVQNRLSQPNYAGARQSLTEVGFETVVGLLNTYAGHARDLAPWLKSAQSNRDRNLRLQYLAGMELNKYQSKEILEAFLSYRRYPDDMVTGTGLYSEMSRIVLKRAISVFRPLTPAEEFLVDP
jgi:spermidine synthase